MEENYQPVGRLTFHDRLAREVEFVTLDGVRVEGVIEFDDVVGCVKYYGPSPEVEGERIRTYHGSGVVRVHWRQS